MSFREIELVAFHKEARPLGAFLCNIFEESLLYAIL
jgi:hypothetical protein